MKELLVSSGEHPIRHQNFTYFQEGAKEVLAVLLEKEAPTAAGLAWIVKGCQITATTNAVSITEGYIYLKPDASTLGKVYYVPAANVSFSPRPGDTAGTVSLRVFNQETVLNPVIYGDGTPNEVYKDEVLVLEDGTAGQVVLSSLIWRADKAGQGCIVDWYSRPGLALSDVLDAGTGLGKGPMLGYAICDGRNNTPDQRGRWRVSYDDRLTDPSNAVWDALYSVLGNTLGEKSHVLTANEIPSHNHNYQHPNVGVSDVGSGGNVAGSGAGEITTYTTSTSSLGGDQAHENRPPSIVYATFQKI